MATNRPLTRICTSTDWRDAGLVRRIAEIYGAPVGTHRKCWELAVGLEALERGSVLHDDAFGLSVAAGHEPLLYHLANRCRWMFATDRYGQGSFAGDEASAAMLADPDLFAPYPYRRNRLTVTCMDALDLRFEDATFDFVVSFGSIEHFGGRAQAERSLAEIARVLRPGGVAFVTTEVAVDGHGDESIEGLELFSPESVGALGASAGELEWLGDVDLSVPDEPVPVRAMTAADLGRVLGFDRYPHIRLGVELPGLRRWREFTSVSIALRRRS